ncbi:MAG: Holliday junction branch migration DNA helicase RuvB [Candidatus Omnitrophica bacterium]|jgi:Holliday junction DNA helicase subunit RuvB|nr:Holliday junction branch migration DNA helicase RuvB [Candidatus Omnitrophota bacterium]
MKSIDNVQPNRSNDDDERLLREPVLTPEETDEDVVLNLSLRPLQFSDFIGQDAVKENLRIGISAAKSRGEPLEHLIFSGPPGLGKTTLAHIISHEMGTKITTTSGPAIERAGDLIGILTNLEQGDILFIDEIHRLSKIVEEFLYPAMEDYKIDFVIDKGPYAKTIKFNLKPFTLIGATTRSGLLTAALRSRFGMHYHLDFYPWPELVDVIKKSAQLLGMPLDEQSAALIAQRARGTPRVANRLLRRVRDYSEVKAQGEVNEQITIAALTLQGVDELGLDEIDRRVLRVIIDTYHGGPVGIESLAATLNEESDTIVDVVEPYLLKIGLLKRGPRGREATELAYKHLGQCRTGDGQKEMFGRA